MDDDWEAIMRKMGVKLGVLGALATAALLTGCDTGDYADYSAGRTWSLTAQEDYLSEQAQSETGKARSNTGTSSGLYETNEQERGTGGAGDAKLNERDNVQTHLQGSERQQENLWLQLDSRVPFPPPPLESQVAVAYGTGKPLRAGPNGAWIQGTYGVELGSGLARANPISSNYQPVEMPQTGEAPPQVPVTGGNKEGFQR